MTTIDSTERVHELETKLANLQNEYGALQIVLRNYEDVNERLRLQLDEALAKAGK